MTQILPIAVVKTMEYSSPLRTQSSTQAHFIASLSVSICEETFLALWKMPFDKRQLPFVLAHLQIMIGLYSMWWIPGDISHSNQTILPLPRWTGGQLIEEDAFIATSQVSIACLICVVWVFVFYYSILIIHNIWFHYGIFTYMYNVFGSYLTFSHFPL